MMSLHNCCYVFGLAASYFCYHGTTQNAVVGFAPTLPSTTTAARTLTRHAAERDGSASTVSGPPYSGPSVKPILDSINFPSDMKGLDMPQIKQVSYVTTVPVLINSVNLYSSNEPTKESFKEKSTSSKNKNIHIVVHSLSYVILSDPFFFSRHDVFLFF